MAIRTGRESLLPASANATPPEKLKRGVLERPDAARMLVTLINDSIAYGPTLVVWVVDQSASARELVLDMGRLLDSPLKALHPPKDQAGEDKLLTAVCSFGADVKFEVDPPLADTAAVCRAIEVLDQDTTGKEMTFAAIKAALDKYLPYRSRQHREVIFILLTDEAGDDAATVDALLDAPKKAGVPFYVVGVPAPFGRNGALDPTVEMGLNYQPNGKWLAIQQGPESRQSENLRLGLWGGGTGLDVLDSGFGPFALERLCRATGGRYLALRSDPDEFAFVSAINSQWPKPGGEIFDAEVMRRYMPDYVSDLDYQALLANKARRAVVDAAQVGELEVLELPRTTFTKSDEAAMARVLSEAQQTAAKLSPFVDRVYSLLEHGEADRRRVTEPRWQANYDLAMGRAAAAKSRVDGYNHMLAALKRGKQFTKPASTAWTLEPANTLEGNSALQKLLDKSRQYLQRVVTDHAGTPWAKLAEKELQSPCGWQWMER